jgi:hypothetical protein
VSAVSPLEGNLLLGRRFLEPEWGTLELEEGSLGLKPGSLKLM